MDVEDQCDLAVAENRRAGHAAQAAKHAAQWLDHGLVLAEQRIDHHAEAAAARPDDDHAAAFGLARFERVQIAQAHHRQHLAAQFDHAAAVRIEFARGRPVLDHLDHRIEREDELGSAHADQEAVDDGQRERQADLDARALARLAVDVDRAAQRFDVAPHDVHADAPTAEVGDLLGGGKPRLEDELEDVGLGRRDALFDQPAVPGALQHLVTPTSATSLTCTRAFLFAFLRSWISWARSSIE